MDAVSRNLGNFFSRFGSSTKWVILSLLLTGLGSYFLIKESFLYAASVFVLVAFLELVDNSVVNVQANRSKLGYYLDAVSNVYIEGAFLFSLLFAALPDFFFPIRGWVSVYIFGFLVAYYVKSASRERDLVKTELKGVLERYERWIILSVGLVLAVFEPLYLTYIVVILAILTNLSALQRIYAVATYSKNKYVITTKIRR